MTDHDAKRLPDRAPLPVLVFNILGGAWVVAGVFLGAGLRQSDEILGGGVLAVLVAVLCLLAATLAFGVAAIVSEVSRLHETES